MMGLVPRARASKSCATCRLSLPYIQPLQAMPVPAAFLGYIDENSDRFIKRLADAVAIPR